MVNVDIPLTSPFAYILVRSAENVDGLFNVILDQSKAVILEPIPSIVVDAVMLLASQFKRITTNFIKRN